MHASIRRTGGAEQGAAMGRLGGRSADPGARAAYDVCAAQAGNRGGCRKILLLGAVVWAGMRRRSGRSRRPRITPKAAVRLFGLVVVVGAGSFWITFSDRPYGIFPTQRSLIE